MPVSDQLRRDVDHLASELADFILFPIDALNEEVRHRPHPDRARADITIALTRVARAQQLLQAARLLGTHSMGTAVVPVVRSLWETWINTAWMLHDASQRRDRTDRFWAAGVAQQLGRIEAFRRRDGTVIPILAQQEELLRDAVRAEPHLYAAWCDAQGRLTVNYHSIRAVNLSWRERCRQLDTHSQNTLYTNSYDLEYFFLSLLDHVEGAELGHLVTDGPAGNTLIHAAGAEEAVDYLIIACGAALMVPYEIVLAYGLASPDAFTTFRSRIEGVRQRYTAEQPSADAQ